MVIPLLGACAESDVIHRDPFVCTPATCPQGACKLQIDFQASCSGTLSTAEIVFGFADKPAEAALEPKDAVFGKTFTSVGQVPVGSKGVFWVRSDRWQWGPLGFECTNPTKDGTFKMACEAAQGATSKNP